MRQVDFEAQAARRQLARVPRSDRCVEVLRVDVHARTRLHQEHGGETGKQREDRQRIKQSHHGQQIRRLLSRCLSEEAAKVSDNKAA